MDDHRIGLHHEIGYLGTCTSHNSYQCRGHQNPVGCCLVLPTPLPAELPSPEPYHHGSAHPHLGCRESGDLPAMDVAPPRTSRPSMASIVPPQSSHRTPALDVVDVRAPREERLEGGKNREGGYHKSYLEKTGAEGRRGYGPKHSIHEQLPLSLCTDQAVSGRNKIMGACGCRRSR